MARTTPAPPRSPGFRRRAAPGGFSLIEMMLATAISATLFTSLLLSLDAMFKSYEQTTDTASTQVITRITVNRILGLIRNGTDFGPLPADVLDSADNPMSSHWFEFVSRRDADGNIEQIARIEFRYEGEDLIEDTWHPENEDPPSNPAGENGPPGNLFITYIDPETGSEEERLLLSGVRQAIFTLHYDIGPHLRRSTVDLTVQPNPDEDATISTDAMPKTVRVVASAMPRRGVE